MANKKHKNTLPFLFTSADEATDEGADNPHKKETTYCPDLVKALEDEFGEDVRRVGLYANEHTVIVEKEVIPDVCRFLKDEQGFEYLTDLGGVDRFSEEERYEVFYNLISLQNRQRLRLKVRVGADDPVVPTVTSVYKSANWNEREAYDMFGIHFEGHPDMRRMYMPEDFEHHPLQKEFPPLGIPGSLPLPAREPEGEPEEDPFPAAEGSPPVKSEGRPDEVKS